MKYKVKPLLRKNRWWGRWIVKNVSYLDKLIYVGADAGVNQIIATAKNIIRSFCCHAGQKYCKANPGTLMKCGWLKKCLKANGCWKGYGCKLWKLQITFSTSISRSSNVPNRINKNDQSTVSMDSLAWVLVLVLAMYVFFVWLFRVLKMT